MLSPTSPCEHAARRSYALHYPTQRPARHPRICAPSMPCITSLCALSGLNLSASLCLCHGPQCHCGRSRARSPRSPALPTLPDRALASCFVPSHAISSALCTCLCPPTFPFCMSLFHRRLTRRCRQALSTHSDHCGLLFSFSLLCEPLCSHLLLVLRHSVAQCRPTTYPQQPAP